MVKLLLDYTVVIIDKGVTELKELIKLTIAQRVRLIRKSHRMSQVAFGRRIGISGLSVSFIELGKKKPSINTIRGIVRAFNVDANYLIN